MNEIFSLGQDLTNQAPSSRSLKEAEGFSYVTADIENVGQHHWSCLSSFTANTITVPQNSEFVAQICTINCLGSF